MPADNIPTATAQTISDVDEVPNIIHNISSRVRISI